MFIDTQNAKKTKISLVQLDKGTYDVRAPGINF